VFVKPLLDGADGVLIRGCHPGDCHYQDGNYKAQRRVDTLKEILKGVGMDEDRVWQQWIAASKV
jgi:F420-non-reducing hydrogenase iron-sulfur subunit